MKHPLPLSRPRTLSHSLVQNSIKVSTAWLVLGYHCPCGVLVGRCKTQNSGLRPKEEKPCDPMNQSSRCNTQEGLLSVAQTRWLWSPGRPSTLNSELGKLLWAKKNTLSAYYIRVTKWLVTCLQSNPIGTNFTGYMFTKAILLVQLRGLLFKLKAILLVQTAWLLFKLRRPRAFQLSRGLLLGAYWLAGSRSPSGGGESHHFTGNRNPSPGRLPAPAPAAPHNKTYFSASKTNKKNIRHMNYRHQ